MFKLNNDFLVQLGLGSLPPVEKNKMLAHIYETLEMRVGVKLAEQMSNEQLDEFEGYINNQDEAGALKWLEANFPNYKDVVAEQLELLKSEISAVAPQIVAQYQETAGQQPQGTQPQVPVVQAQATSIAPATVQPPQPAQQTAPMQPQQQTALPVQPLSANPQQPLYQQPTTPDDQQSQAPSQSQIQQPDDQMNSQDQNPYLNPQQ